MGANIPLPALQLHPVPQGPDILEQMGKLQALKYGQGQQQIQQQTMQSNDLSIQQQQQAAKDRDAMTKSMQDSSIDWSDPNSVMKLPAIVLKNGGSSNAVFGIQQHLLEQKKNFSAIAKDDAETGQKNLQTTIDTGKAIGGKIDALEQVPDEQLHDTVMGGIQDMVTSKLMPPDKAQALVQQISHIQDPKALRAQLDVFKKTSMGMTAVAEQANKEASTAKELAQQREADANANFKNQELAAGGTGAMADNRYRQITEAQLLKQPVSAGDAAFVKAYEKQKTLVPRTTISLQGNLLNDQAKQMAAQNYTETGALPSGLRSPAMAAGILNQAAGAPGGIPDIAGNKMAYGADTASLHKLQTNFDQVSAFENTAGKNLDVFLNQAKKVVDSGSPWLNKPLRAVDAGALGSEDQAAFNAARVTAITEIAKVLNSSNASGVLSDSARHEVEGLIGPNATMKMIVSAANVLKTDMGNRHQAYVDQIKEIKSRHGGSPAVNTDPAKPWEKYPVHQ